MPAEIAATDPGPGVVLARQTRTDPQDPKADRYARYRLEGLNSTELRILAGEPTYEVRGYRDTGLGVAGQQVLAPMVPYGYLMEHRGPLIGWKHDLVGVGTTVTTLIPGVLYKISVLPGGKATVQTQIHALEKGAQVPPVHGRCSCDLAQRNPGHRTAAIVLLAGLAFVQRRRKQLRAGSTSLRTTPRLPSQPESRRHRAG